MRGNYVDGKYDKNMGKCCCSYFEIEHGLYIIVALEFAYMVYFIIFLTHITFDMNKNGTD